MGAASPSNALGKVDRLGPHHDADRPGRTDHEPSTPESPPIRSRPGAVANLHPHVADIADHRDPAAAPGGCEARAQLGRVRLAFRSTNSSRYGPQVRSARNFFSDQARLAKFRV